MSITFAAGAYIDKSGTVTAWDVATGSSALWFRRSGRPAGNQPVIQAKYSSSGSGSGIGIFLEVTAGANQDKLGMQIKNSSGTQVNLIYHPTQTVFDGNWHLASMDWNQANGAASNLYYDGVKATANNSGAWNWPLMGIRYARSPDSFWGSFDGSLANGCWWNEQLSAGEHDLLARGISPLLIRPGAIIMYLPMDDSGAPIDYGRNAFAVTKSGTLSRGTTSHSWIPLHDGFLFDTERNAIDVPFARKHYSAYRTAHF